MAHPIYDDEPDDQFERAVGVIWETIGQRQQAYESVFSSPQGRQVLADLLEFTGYFKDAFDVDSHRMANNLGKVRVMQRIVSFVAMPPDEMRRIAETIASQQRHYDPLAER